MNANDVIECYVSEVAVQLPRKQRNDVAFELRALLTEGLQDQAEGAGRDADVAMATEFLNAFGRPEDVAARYRPTLTIIDPVDGHGFLRATVIGLALIWSLGLLLRLRQPIDSLPEVLILLGQWWGGTVIPSLWWPGALVVGYAMAAAARRRRPHTATWTPRASDRIHGGRSAKALALVGVLCGVYLLANPTWILDVIWNGRAAPAAYEALTYTDTFRQRQGPWLLLLLLLNIPIFFTVIVMGRWSTSMRHLETAHSLILCAALAWTVADGPVFMTTAADRSVKFFLVLTIVATALTLAIKLYRQVKPMPAGLH